MPSLTLKGIPDDLMERLRGVADEERRSLNQQAILLLEEALAERRPSFGDAYDAFRRHAGPSPVEEGDLTALRSPDPGRDVEG